MTTNIPGRPEAAGNAHAMRVPADVPGASPGQALPARPAAWSAIRDELYPALCARGLTAEAAGVAAERGADAAIVEARLVTLAEARRWGRPYDGRPLAAPETGAPAADPDAAVHALRRDLQVASAAWEALADAVDMALKRAEAAVPARLPKVDQQARLARARDAEGYPETKAAEEAAHAAIGPMLERMKAAEPVTLAGYAAMVAALLAAIVDPDDDGTEPADVIPRLMLAEAERLAAVRS